MTRPPASNLKQLREKNRVSRSALTDEGRADLWPNMTPTQAAHALQRWMNIQVNVSRRIANLESMDSILLAVEQLSLRLLKSDMAGLALWNNDRTVLETKYLALPNRAAAVNMVEPSPLLQKLMRSTRAYRFPDGLPGQNRKWTINGQEVVTGIIAPLALNGQSIGGIWVASFSSRPYHLVDVMGLRSLSEQVTIALEYGMMKNQLQSMAVLEERSRIAREMHDSVSQTLLTLGFEMLTLESKLQQGECAAALQEITHVRDIIKNAQADVRENILSLRTTLDGTTTVQAALQKYLGEYGLQTGLSTHWSDITSEAPGLSPLQEVQLVRVVQEALSNVRKHAQAKNVWVSLRPDESRMVVTIRDDGIGFQMTPEAGRFGLQTMRERIESVEGWFSIHSQPGRGTIVEVRLPIMAEDDDDTDQSDGC